MPKQNDIHGKNSSDCEPQGKKPYIQPELIKNEKLVLRTGVDEGSDS